MTKETQNIEWKETWRDEYMKWVCGVKACRLYNMPKPVVKSEIAGLWFTFNFKQETTDSQNKLGDKLGDKLGVNRQAIIKAIKENKQITLSSLAEMLNISNTAIENNIRYLKRNGYIKRIGNTKSGHWEVQEKE